MVYRALKYYDATSGTYRLALYGPKTDEVIITEIIIPKTDSAFVNLPTTYTTDPWTVSAHSIGE